MSHNILITGASGYLGGTLLTRWKEANLPPYNKLYALIRTEEQANAVQTLYNAEPVQIDLRSDVDIEQAIISRDISIIYYLIDPLEDRIPRPHGSCAGHTGLPADRVLLDTDEELYDLLKDVDGPQPLLVQAGKRNVQVIDDGASFGVRSYIFAPCIVYGKGQGFGNPISIQTVAVIRAAKKMRKIYTVDDSSARWPVCHIDDNTTLFLSILRDILSGQNLSHGKNGFYLASSGLVKWHDLYRVFSKRLLERGVIDDDTITPADDAALEEIATVLRRRKSFVPAEIGGRCTFTAARGHAIGWKAEHPPEHIFETAGEEVDLVLQHS
ncbi:NAD dependent epimerase/dehydratase family protein [Talaromyces marneffei ATCC 18224]|uniref:NAD dependent epimerase/dehydratase family protein n=1 Tax=Talaromyces marneffei (strain ATCC 18224 / CBS 334.59 / QM 7333) TaxID=441960 RepID=B6QLN2_TALMQ|nr:NAD dependent epimerase/dehydratase family protein [Talaromyces marneffei ATCC 18224]